MSRAGSASSRSPCSPPGGVWATPPSRHYERDVRTHQCETEGLLPLGTANGFAKAGRSQKIAAWSAERRASPGCADGASRCVTQGRAISPAGLRQPRAEGCLARTQVRCRRSAPSPLCEGEPANLGGK